MLSIKYRLSITNQGQRKYTSHEEVKNREKVGMWMYSS